MSAQSDTTPRVNLQLEQAIQAILSDRPIAYHAALARALGSVTAGVLLSQLLYWQPRSQDSEGWFWKTQAEIYDETGLTRTEQETARKVLMRAKVIEEKRRGVPARMHFRVALGRVIELLSQHHQRPGVAIPPPGPADLQPAAVQFAGNPQSRLRETAQLDRGEPPNWIAGNPQTITETITETTPEITSQTTESNRFESEISHQSDEELSFSRKRNFAKNRIFAPKPENPNRPQRPAPTSVGDLLTNGYADRLPHKPATAPERPVEVTKPSRGTKSQGAGRAAPLRASTGRGRPPKATEQIRALIEQFSDELHDELHIKPNISQAARLWKASGLSEDAFCQRLYEARSITKQYDVQKRADGEAGRWGARNKMPYYFAVLRDLLGMKNDPIGLSHGSSR